ncbi:hypothetical protein EGW08_018576, partial [Elysia chlorotica]
ASKELKHLRVLYSGESQCLQQAQAEVHALKAKQVQLLADKSQLLQEVAALQRQISPGAACMSPDPPAQSAGSGPSPPDSPLLDSHEALRADHEVLRDKYQGLLSSHTAALDRLDQLSDEASASQAALCDLRVKAEVLTQERNGLKQQCTDAIRKWNQTLIENSQTKEKLGMVINQRDSLSRDFNQTFARHAELKKSYEALRAEKDAAVKEYALVMSERDTVHKEIEQLQDKLSTVSKRTDSLAADKMDLEKQLEASRRDMAAVLSERDKYRREWSDVSGINQGLKHERQELKMRMEQQRDMARLERNEALGQMEQILKDSYEKTQKEKAEEIDSILKESDNLKKQVEKLKLDLENSEQEAENANKNRDKAFSERDKIVQERESIRTLCDNLRRDRDRAVSDLAQALRDSDEFKRQKNEAVKELKEIKSRYEAIVEKDSRRHQLHYIGHNHSRDSAIDADLQDLGTEAVEVQVELENPNSGQLGFEMVGGKDDPQFPNDPSLFVSHVTKGSAAEGRLKVNDMILKINSLEALNVEKMIALQAIWKSPRSVNVTVRRRKYSAARTWQPVQIILSAQKEPGIKVEQGLFISRCCPGAVVAKFGMLPCVGDRIININNIPADSLSVSEAMHLLESSSESLVLDLWRQSSPLNSAGSSPTPTSTGVGSSTAQEAPAAVSGAAMMSKSDSMVAWGPDCSKNLRTSGSQTDSLDSPGSSPRKEHASQDSKVRHSMPMLDKAKVTVEKIFSRSRHKSQEDKAKEKDEQLEQHRKAKEKVIAEFPNNPAALYSHAAEGANNDRYSKSSRKREIELDSNSGTWPKTRSQQAPSTCGPPTVIALPGHKAVKTRPSIREVFYGPASSEAASQGVTVHHSAQNSDSSIKYPNTCGYPSAAAAASAFSPATSPSSAAGPVNSSLVSSSVQNTSLSLSQTSKAPSHFTVGIMHGPGHTPPYPLGQPAHSVASYQHHTVVGPGRPRHSPGAQLYGTIPGPKAAGGTLRGSLVSSHLPPHSHAMPQPQHPPHSHGMADSSSALHPYKMAPRVLPMKSRQRPTSTPHKPEGWQAPPPAWHTVSDESSQLGHTPPPGSSLSRLSASSSTASSSYMLGLGSGSPPSHPHGLSSPPAYGARPTSMEIQGPLTSAMRVTDYASEIHERHQRVASPVGYLGRPPQYQAFRAITPSSGAQTGPGLSSPPGTFPVISPIEGDHDHRPLSYHGALTDRYSSPSPSQKSQSTLERFTPTISEELYPTRYARASPHGQAHLGRAAFMDEDVVRHQNAFAAKRDVFERIRIPSTTSVNTKSGSVEIVSDRSSPGSPLFHLDPRGSLNQKVSPQSDEYMFRKTPSHHETRDILFEKSSKPVGFKIQGGPSGGIFVSSVNDNSLAAQAGLVIGDQLLEVCGINMRNANYEHAVTVLRQCDDNLTMKVQYNPDKYTDHGGDLSSSASINSSSLTVSQSLSPKHASQQTAPEAKHQARAFNQVPIDSCTDKRRFISLKKSNPNMIGPGFSFIGGNAVGIFVNEVYSDCFVGSTHSLQRGDHILEFNSVDFRSVTAEKAMVELTRPCASIELCVFYNFAKFNKIRKMPCDSFYIRANFERPLENGDGLDLAFRRDDVLYVEDSLYRGQLGSWFAWLLDPQGNKLHAGVVPSRIRLEDELVLRRTHSESWSLHEADDLKGSSRRSSASARRSFFRRKRHHRNSSRDSQEFGNSFSDASLNSDSVPILDDSKLGYTQVEKISLNAVRPVVLLAPLADALMKKLVSESPDKYRECETVAMRTSPATME